MRAHPNRGLVSVILLLGLVLVACGQSASSGAPSDGGGTATRTPAATGTPAATDGGTGATPAPTTQGGGGTGNVPSLPNGEWTGGTAHAEVTGDVTGSFDAPLMVGLATTDGPSTTLTYLDPANGSQIGVAINGNDVALSVASSGWVGGGGTTTTCTYVFTKGDATSVAGTITCPASPVIDGTGAQGKFADIVVTFEATR